jgi:hypothetical protein
MLNNSTLADQALRLRGVVVLAERLCLYWVGGDVDLLREWHVQL